MTGVINLSPATSIMSPVELEIPVHIASSTSLVQRVRAEAVTQVLETVTLPEFEESGIHNIPDSQVCCRIHRGHATAGHDCPVHQNDWAIVKIHAGFRA